MGLFGATNIIPDDVADKVAQRFFEFLNRGLEYNIDENICVTHSPEELNLKPFSHYHNVHVHFKLKYDKQIEPDMEFRSYFLKGNGYISCDRFQRIHALNEESFLKMLGFVKKKFEAQNKHFLYKILYDKYYKSLCFVPFAYMTLQEKLLLRGDGKGKTSYCRFPMPDHQFFKLEPARFKTVQDRPDLQVNVELQGITLLSEKEVRSCMNLITFQQKPVSWWIRDPLPSLINTQVMQPNEIFYAGIKESRNGISPAVIGDFRGFAGGDKVLFAGHKWTVIFENMIFVDDLIGYGPFNYYHRDSVYYETSRVKDFIEHWFEQHRNDPVYRASR